MKINLTDFLKAFLDRATGYVARAPTQMVKPTTGEKISEMELLVICRFFSTFHWNFRYRYFCISCFPCPFGNLLGLWLVELTVNEVWCEILRFCSERDLGFFNKTPRIQLKFAL